MRAPHRCWCLSATVADFRRTFAISVANDVRCVVGVQFFGTGAGVQDEVGDENRGAVDVRRSSSAGSGGGSHKQHGRRRQTNPQACAAADETVKPERERLPRPVPSPSLCSLHLQCRNRLLYFLFCNARSFRRVSHRSSGLPNTAEQLVTTQKCRRESVCNRMTVWFCSFGPLESASEVFSFVSLLFVV